MMTIGKYAVVSNQMTQEQFLNLTGDMWRQIAEGIWELKEDCKIDGMENVLKGKNVFFVPTYHDRTKFSHIWGSIHCLGSESSGDIKSFEITLGGQHNEFLLYKQPYGFMTDLSRYKNIGFSIALETTDGRCRVMRWDQIKAVTGLTDQIEFYNIHLPL